MIDQLRDFFAAEGFAPHGFCLMWRPDVFWLHVVSDSVIALAYFSIPAVLLVYAFRRKSVPNRGLLFMFSAFVLACGVTHLFGIWTMWFPHYGAEGVAKGLTAIVSMATAVVLWPLLPKALKIPTIRELKARVDERTSELEAANAALRDEIRRRAEIEARLVEARNAAESANNAKSGFLSVMSHELRTPLNVILGYAQLIQMRAEADADEKLAGQVGNVRRGGEHLLRLIDDILDLSRIEVGGLSMSPAPLPLADAVKTVTEALAPIATARGVTLALDDGGASDIAVHADQARLRQVLSNLITNAIKYNDEGGTVVVAVARAEDGRCELKVSDDGWGVPPERRAELFQPFNRLGREATDKDGAGIGLVLTRRIVELMDGAIRYEPREGGGSTFVIVLPTISGSEAAAPSANVVDIAVEPKRLTVLYIEDNHSNIELMREILEEASPAIRLDVATSGMAGVEKARLLRPDLIFLDIGLPDIDGFGVLGRLRGIFGANMPRVVVVSADATEATRERSKREGVWEFLPKPIDVGEVARLVGDPTPGAPRARLAG